MKNQNQKQTTEKKFLTQEGLINEIEKQLQYWLDNPSNYYIIEKAKKEQYFGAKIKKDKVGLLGYLRQNFAMQIKILNNYGNAIEIEAKYCNFLRSDWFKNAVIKNGHISHNLHFKNFKEHNFK